jgi:hypothetical protein
MAVNGQLHAPAACPWYPLARRLGGPQSQSGRGGEEKNSQLLPGLEPPIIQPVAQRYTTELSRLLGPISGYFEHGNKHSGSIKGEEFID